MYEDTQNVLAQTDFLLLTHHLASDRLPPLTKLTSIPEVWAKKFIGRVMGYILATNM